MHLANVDNVHLNRLGSDHGFDIRQVAAVIIVAVLFDLLFVAHSY